MCNLIVSCATSSSLGSYINRDAGIAVAPLQCELAEKPRPKVEMLMPSIVYMEEARPRPGRRQQLTAPLAGELARMTNRLSHSRLYMSGEASYNEAEVNG